jgi:DMSO/TMAO reductase YedYZ molybdopterin-dependent catalytic subunit
MLGAQQNYQDTSAPEPRWRAVAARIAPLGRWMVIPLIAGLLGSLAAVIVMIGLRLLWGSPTLPELVGERILPMLTVDQFIQLLLRFAPNSKTIPLLYALLGQLALGSLIGPAWALTARSPTPGAGRWPTRRAWFAAGTFALGMETLTLLLFWPALFGNLIGYPIASAVALNSLATLIVFAVFMAVVALCDHWLRLAWGAAFALTSPARGDGMADAAVSGATPAAPVAAGPLTQAVSRRAALGSVGVVALGAGVGFLATRELIAAYLARSNLTYEGMQTDYAVSRATQLTPNQNFYVVSKNVLDPTVVVDHWRLEIAGMVRQPRVWTYAEAQALPSETRAVTFECIANGVGGHLMSTAEWTGFTLARAIAEAGAADPRAKYVVFSSVDGYVSSLPLADLLEARTLLAYKMNGATLPERHGYPLRAVVPGRYGEQSPKWLTRIELSDQPRKGFYQSQGWYDGQVHTVSRIEQPATRKTVPLAPITVGGLAFAGIRGIKRVEISADNGATWSDATLVPPLSDQTWVYWTWRWTPPARGTWTLVARATDGTGAVQTATETSTVPNGATGRHHVTVTVA